MNDYTIHTHRVIWLSSKFHSQLLFTELHRRDRSRCSRRVRSEQLSRRFSASVRTEPFFIQSLSIFIHRLAFFSVSASFLRHVKVSSASTSNITQEFRTETTSNIEFIELKNFESIYRTYSILWRVFNEDSSLKRLRIEREFGGRPYRLKAKLGWLKVFHWKPFTMKVPLLSFAISSASFTWAIISSGAHLLVMNSSQCQWLLDDIGEASALKLFNGSSVLLSSVLLSYSVIVVK